MEFSSTNLMVQIISWDLFSIISAVFIAGIPTIPLKFDTIFGHNLPIIATIATIAMFCQSSISYNFTVMIICNKHVFIKMTIDEDSSVSVI